MLTNSPSQAAVMSRGIRAIAAPARTTAKTASNGAMTSSQLASASTSSGVAILVASFGTNGYDRPLGGPSRAIASQVAACVIASATLALSLR